MASRRGEHEEGEHPSRPLRVPPSPLSSCDGPRAASGSGAVGPGRAVAAALLALALAGAGCTRDLVERAIAARGGPLLAVTREVRAKVHQGIPGEWTWELGFRAPGDVRWTLHTWGEDQSYILEGGSVTYLLGASRLPAPPEATAAMMTQSRWLAVVLLDVLRDHAAVSWIELPKDDLPAGVAASLEARFADGGPPYRLYFDATDLLVRAEGEVSLPPIGEGPLWVKYEDFRETEGYALPYRAVYELAGRPLLEEEVLHYSIEPLVPTGRER